MKIATVILASGSSLALAAAAQAQTGATANAASPVSASPSPVATTQTGAQGGPGDAVAASTPDIIVTAQKRAERLQDVPIAVSAFSGETLKEQRIESGNQLNQYVPNFSFNRANYGETNFQIRGVGFQLATASGDTGVGVHENNAPLGVNRLADADFYDLERIEVLRGPQGTLYGRNATGGVVNLITAKPTKRLEGSATMDVGSYGTMRLQGFLNVPVADWLQVRAAGTLLERAGFQHNIDNGRDLDGRNINSTRLTIAFQPSSRFRGYAMWERFLEHDDRTGGYLTFCTKDSGPSAVGGVAVTNPAARAFLSQGCANSTVTAPGARGTVNSVATLSGLLAIQAGAAAGDINGNRSIDNLRDVAVARQPDYRAANNLYQLNLEYDFADHLTATSLTAYSTDNFRQFFALETTAGTGKFLNTAVSPNGTFNDPQVGMANTIVPYGYNYNTTKQWSQELRVQSAYSGPLNFSIGGIYYDQDRFRNSFIGSNAVTLYASLLNLRGAGIGIDPGFPPDGSGHNYALTSVPYRLISKAAFGEVYWQPLDTVKLTGGLRYTDDIKRQTVLPVQLLQPGLGFPANPIEQRVEFREVTGRFTADWTPRLSFTDKTLIYASYARGYKGGGFNPPDLVSTSPSFAPEFVNAFEIGTKNTLANGAILLNLTGFYYDYKNYQISQIAGVSAQTINLNAKIKGLEFETVVTPVRQLRFNANVGYLDTRIEGGNSIDPFNRTQGDPSLTVLKSSTSACVGQTAVIARLVDAINRGIVPATALIGACPTAAAPAGAFASNNPAVNPLAALGVVLPTNAGIPVQLDGKQVPLSPHWTISGGGQYTVDLSSSWAVTGRADVYHQTGSYDRYYNDLSDRLPGYTNVNLSLTLSNKDQGFTAQAYVKNAFNTSFISFFQVASELVGQIRTGYVNDPRVIGVALTKRF